MIRAAMTSEEAQAALKALRPQIKRYAQLIVRKGVNVQEGQETVIQAPIETAAFVHMLAGSAYEAGAGHVTVIWADDELTRLTPTSTSMRNGSRRCPIGSACSSTRWRNPAPASSSSRAPIPMP